MSEIREPSVEELSTSACWSLLRNIPVGRIALHGVDDIIEVFPVNFVVDHGTVVFKTAAGTKLELAHEHRPSTFEADHFDFYRGTAWSVVAKGQLEVIEGHEAIKDTSKVDVRAWQSGHKPTYIRFVPDLVTGRRFPIDPAANHSA